MVLIETAAKQSVQKGSKRSHAAFSPLKIKSLAQGQQQSSIPKTVMKSLALRWPDNANYRPSPV